MVPIPYSLILMDIFNVLFPTPYHSYPVPITFSFPSHARRHFPLRSLWWRVLTIIFKTKLKCPYVFGRLFSVREAAIRRAFTILEPIIKNSRRRSNFILFLGRKKSLSSISYHNFDLVSKLNILSITFHIVCQTAVHISYSLSSLTVVLY